LRIQLEENVFVEDVDLFYPTIELIQVPSGGLLALRKVILGVGLVHLFVTQYTIRGSQRLLTGETETLLERNSVQQEDRRFIDSVSGRYEVVSIAL